MSFKYQAVLACWLLSALYLSPAAFSTAAVAAETGELIQGLIARGDAIFSGRFQYWVNIAPGPDGPAKLHVEFTMSGESWKRQFIGTDDLEVNHNGKWVQFTTHPQPDGDVDLSTKIGPARRVERDQPYCPFFLGTFWREQTRDFVQANSSRAQRHAPVEVNGHTCSVLEFIVRDRKDAHAGFHEVDDVIINGGSLRLYIAPELGYCIPRYEYLDKNGKVHLRFESEEFKEVAPGVYFPMRSEKRWITTGNVFTSYAMESVEDVNEAIPDSSFVVHLPEGTFVEDVRNPKRTFPFVVTEMSPVPSDLSDVVSMPSSGRTTWRAILLGVGMGVLLLAIVFALVRRFRRAA